MIPRFLVEVEKVLIRLPVFHQVWWWVGNNTGSAVVVKAKKQELIRSMADVHDCWFFVETGTYKGETLNAVWERFQECYSVELDDFLFEMCERRFRGNSRIHLFKGDSGEILPGILDKIKEPALFWLDAHYSGGITALGEKASPIMDELNVIMKHPVKGHVILIDDVRETFTRKNGVPSVSGIESWFIKNKRVKSFSLIDNIFVVVLN